MRTVSQASNVVMTIVQTMWSLALMPVMIAATTQPQPLLLHLIVGHFLQYTVLNKKKIPEDFINHPKIVYFLPSRLNSKISVKQGFKLHEKIVICKNNKL